MTTLISFPFRIDPSGAVAVRDDGEDAYMAEELAQLIQTHPGERELVPTYGLNDPAFSDFDQAMLEAQVLTFGPPVRVDGVEVRVLSDAQQDVIVRFSPTESYSGVGGGTPIADDTLVASDDDDTSYEEYED